MKVQLTKICKGCGKIKSILEFDRNGKMKDGRLNKCKSCVSLYNNSYKRIALEDIIKSNLPILDEISKGIVKYSIDELKLWINDVVISNDKINQIYGRNNWFEFKFPHEDNCIKYYTSFLDKNANISERIYCILNDITEQQLCISCGNKIEYNGRMVKGYPRFCSHKCSANNEETKRKCKNTCIDTYGVPFPLQNEEIMSKMCANNIINFGVPYVSMRKEIQDNQITNNIIKYGVEYTFQREDVKLKCVESYINNFGVDNPMKDFDIFEKQQKSGFKRKEYISPDNKTFLVQGFEPFALKYLIEELGYNSNDIIVGKEVPMINYFYENKEHKYFPDLYIKYEKTLVEVKSNWTYKLHKERNKIKQKSSKENGYNHLMLIFNKKGEITEII